MPNRHGQDEDYRYGFQGQEMNDEISGQKGAYVGYKFRMNDTRIGRFLSIDPLTSKYPHYSPYSFSGNKVIAYTELEGLEEESIHNKAVKAAYRSLFDLYKAAEKAGNTEAMNQVKTEFDALVKKTKLQPSNEYRIEVRTAEVAFVAAGNYTTTKVYTDKGNGTYLNGRTIEGKEGGGAVGVGPKAGIKGSVLTGTIKLKPLPTETAESPEQTLNRAGSSTTLSANVSTVVGGYEKGILVGNENTTGSVQRLVYSGTIGGFSGGASVGAGVTQNVPIATSVPTLTSKDSATSIADNIPYEWAQKAAVKKGWANGDGGIILDSVLNNQSK